MTTQESKNTNKKGGLTVEWLLAAPVRSFVSKTSGKTKTVVELRDPTRLGNSLVVFLDGEAAGLARIEPSTIGTLHVEEVRSGQGRGELIGTATRKDVEQAFGVSGGEHVEPLNCSSDAYMRVWVDQSGAPGTVTTTRIIVAVAREVHAIRASFTDGSTLTEQPDGNGVVKIEANRVVAVIEVLAAEVLRWDR